MKISALFQEHKTTLSPDQSRDLLDDMMIRNGNRQDASDRKLADTALFVVPDSIETLCEFALLYS